MRDLPTISGSTYASSAVNMGALINAGQGIGLVSNSAATWRDMGAIDNIEQYETLATFANTVATTTTPQQENKPMAVTRRLVQLFISDPNENVPLEDSLLYSGEQKLTDATDQELFFEIDIKSILEKHNAKRVKMVDKKVKERTEYLEAAKIRDLKMVVVNVAQF